MIFDIVFQVSRWVLIAAFAIAGFTKIMDQARTKTEFTDIGVPYPKVAAWVIPIIEMNIAGALYAFPAWGAVAAFALLTAFTTTLAMIIRSGRTVSCACFGAIATSPVGKSQVYRNWVLMAMALIVALAA